MATSADSLRHRPKLRRAALVAAAGQVLLAVVTAYAAVTLDGRDASMFALLALCSLLGAAAAGVLAGASTPSASGSSRVSLAVSLVAVSFLAGTAAAFVGMTFAALLLPALLLFANGMLVGAARGVQSGAADAP